MEDKKPDFLIIGFARCGTTALGRNLNLHPEVNCSLKEGLFFDKNKEHMRNNLIFKEGKINGEKSPYYIIWKHIMKDIYKSSPNVKIIICMRNPIQMLHSFYNHRIDEFYKSKIKGVNPKETDFSKIILENLEVNAISLKRGNYLKYIKRNVLPFFKKEQILFIIQEQMFKDTQKEMNRIFDFLGVKTIEKDFFKKSNYDEESRYPNINYDSEDYKKALKKIFKYYKRKNKKLFRFLGYEIKEWEEIDDKYTKSLLDN